MHKLIIYSVVVLCFSSCGDSATKEEALVEESVVTEPSVQAQTIETDVLGEDTLEFTYGNGTKDFLVLNGQGNEFIVSPDSQKIVVDTRLLSNLSITRVYSRDKAGKVQIAKPLNLSALVWDSMAIKYQISVEEVISPKTNAIRWLDDGSKIELEVRGGTEMGLTIAERVVINLKK